MAEKIYQSAKSLEFRIKDDCDDNEDGEDDELPCVIGESERV